MFRIANVKIIKVFHTLEWQCYISRCVLISRAKLESRPKCKWPDEGKAAKLWIISIPLPPSPPLQTPRDDKTFALVVTSRVVLIIAAFRPSLFSLKFYSSSYPLNWNYFLCNEKLYSIFQIMSVTQNGMIQYALSLPVIIVIFRVTLSP